MNKTITNVLLCGVGGQGIITASHLLAQACLQQGWQIKKSEIHGKRPFGGSVESHVRFSPQETVYSPTIPDGEVDVLIGFELLETLRGLPQVREDGAIIADTRRIMPMPVAMGAATYPDDAAAILQTSGRRVVLVPGFAEAVALGEPRAANIIMLGAAAAVLPITVEMFENAIRTCLKPKLVDINLAAFRRGVQLGANSR